ncbi:MAG: glycosyltransferase family 1 protein, partial [bacterium]
RDVTALAEALKRMSVAPALRFRMGQAGREKVLKEFNLKTNTATLAELIRQVAKTPRAKQMAVYATPRQTSPPAVETIALQEASRSC